MKFSMKQLGVAALCAATLYTPMAFADWYTSHRNLYTTKDKTDGGMYAILGRNAKHQVNIYFERLRPTECKMIGSDVQPHDPLYINDTLIPTSTYCRGSWQVVFPANATSREHVILQFLMYYQVKMQDESKSITVIFSAKGFNERYLRFVSGEHST